MPAEPFLSLHRRVRRSVVLGFAGAGIGALLAACGGGGDGGIAEDAVRQPTAQSVGTVTMLGSELQGSPVDVSVARSANGDAMVVWRTGTDLWASRFVAAADAWQAPVRIDASDGEISEDYGVTADARGNAVVAWSQSGASGRLVVSARFDATNGAWAPPVGRSDAHFRDPGLVRPASQDSHCAFAAGLNRLRGACVGDCFAATNSWDSMSPKGRERQFAGEISGR